MNKRLFATAALLALILMTAGGVTSCKNANAGPPEAVTYGNIPVESAALIYIAEDQGFFAASGLSVSSKSYATGLASVNGMLNGEVDIGAGAEYAIVGKIFSKETITILGTFDKAQTIYVIGRKDKGVSVISDLKGKRIGVVRQTTLEFYLGRFLNLNGINLNDVTLADVKSPQYEDAIMSGDMDAIICNQPYVDAIKNRLGDNAVIWPAQNAQPTNSLLVCKQDWAANHPQTIIRFLKALAQAENYVASHPAEARATVQKRQNYTDSYMAGIWPNHRFILTLDQSLIAAMTDEAHWMIANGLTTEKETPDFRQYIYTDGLKAVKPNAVNIVK